MAHQEEYRSIAAVAQARKTAAIPEELLLPAETVLNLPKNITNVPHTCGHFTHDEIEIIESQAEDILDKIKHGIWTATEVTRAFCHSAAVANQLTNCLTEVFFDEALVRAKELDEHLQQTGEVLGPFHGLPVSLKDFFVTPPHPSSLGMSHYANAPTTDESLHVTMLRELGAVLYCKTNVPTAMMMMETDNVVWGKTVNPNHTGCNAGGSSGGCAALLSMRGSPLSVGSDIGGSIRIPAAFNGLYGLKPSFGRFPVRGLRSGIPGNEFVLAVQGPISRSLDSVRLYAETLLSASAAPWKRDPRCLPIPWRQGPHIDPPGRPLRLAFLPANDGLVTAHPPVERALLEARKAVIAAGHTVIDWQPEGHPEIVKALVAAFLDFGGTPIMQLLAPYNEPVFQGMSAYQKVASIGEADLGPSKLRAMNIAKAGMAEKMLDRWRAAKLDGLVMPASPWAAVRQGFTNSGPSRAYYGYTAVWNLLDMPACTLPVSTVDQTLDKRRTSDWTPLGDVDRTIQDDYDPAFYHGAPVSLQVVGERLQEEKLLEMVAMIKETLQSKPSPL